MSSDVTAVFLKLDGRFRHYIYDPSAKLLNQVALSVVTREMSGLGFEKAALEALVVSKSDNDPALTTASNNNNNNNNSSLSTASPSAMLSSSFPSNPKTRYNSNLGRYRKDADTHHFEDIFLVEDASDTEGWPCSLQINLEGVRLRGHGQQEQLFSFKSIPRYRSDLPNGYFEFEYDRPGGNGVHRFRSNQVPKIAETMSVCVEKLLKIRNTKKS